MYSIEKATENFKNTYFQGIREEFDLGEVNSDSILTETQNDYQYFINRVNPKDEIHISIPFNLRLLKQFNDNKFKTGWKELLDLDKYWFFGNQNANFLLLGKEDNQVYAIFHGSNDIVNISKSFSDFIEAITRTMLLTNKYLEKHYVEDDFLVFDDESYLKEIHLLIDHFSLEISKENFKDFFVG